MMKSELHGSACSSVDFLHAFTNTSSHSKTVVIQSKVDSLLNMSSYWMHFTILQDLSFTCYSVNNIQQNALTVMCNDIGSASCKIYLSAFQDLASTNRIVNNI
mmetsp:Transcript_11481/g.20286  ORF Transcript_11481/g.20286 Transcript_11481/m.20286 type:complete len:103 (+) Transcript_11481:77-385(+)